MTRRTTSYKFGITKYSTMACNSEVVLSCHPIPSFFQCFASSERLPAHRPPQGTRKTRRPQPQHVLGHPDPEHLSPLILFRGRLLLGLSSDCPAPAGAGRRSSVQKHGVSGLALVLVKHACGNKEDRDVENRKFRRMPSYIWRRLVQDPSR